MSTPQPTLKDTAEFLRMALHLDLCKCSPVVRWADGIIALEAAPPPVLFDLSTCDTRYNDPVIELLSTMPGQATGDLPVHMLLGYCHRLLKLGRIRATTFLRPLYLLALIEHFPDPIYNQLSGLEDALSLACDGVYGTLLEVDQDFLAYLVDFESFSPELPDEEP